MNLKQTEKIYIGGVDFMNLGSIKDKSSILKKKTTKRIFTVTAVFCVAALSVTYLVALTARPNEQAPVLEAPAPTEKPVSNDSGVTVEKPVITVPTPAPDENKDDSAVSGETTVTKAMLSPVNGAAVLKGYASDSLVYSNTLKHWATHTAMDFTVEEGTTVIAVLDGTVSAVENDALMGLTVKVSHDNGLETVYSCLEAVPDGIKEGASVLRGQAIGNVGNSGASESADGAHLHFEVLKDGKSVNPQSYLSSFSGK